MRLQTRWREETLSLCVIIVVVVVVVGVDIDDRDSSILLMPSLMGIVVVVVVVKGLDGVIESCKDRAAWSKRPSGYHLVNRQGGSLPPAEE